MCVCGRVSAMVCVWRLEEGVSTLLPCEEIELRSPGLCPYLLCPLTGQAFTLKEVILSSVYNKIFCFGKLHLACRLANDLFDRKAFGHVGGQPVIPALG